MYRRLGFFESHGQFEKLTVPLGARISHLLWSVAQKNICHAAYDLDGVKYWINECIEASCLHSEVEILKGINLILSRSGLIEAAVPSVSRELNYDRAAASKTLLLLGFALENSHLLQSESFDHFTSLFDMYSYS